MPHSGPPGHTGKADIKGGGVSTRCRACQLQLCKSRREPPHAALEETSRDEMMHFVRYECKSCGTKLICSQEFGVSGWAVVR